MTKMKKFMKVLKWYFDKYKYPLSTTKYNIILRATGMNDVAEEDFDDEIDKKIFLSIEEHYQYNNTLTDKIFKDIQILEKL